MGGRPGKTIDWHIANGNRRHLTKSEIADRQEHESSVRSGVKSFKATEYVMKDMVALNMFKKLKKLFKNIDCIEGMDENIINRYCLLCSEANALEKLLVNMNNDVDECEEPSDRLALYKAITGTESNLLRIREMQIKIEDRLLMNPTARIKNVPVRAKKSAGDPNADLFD